MELDAILDNLSDEEQIELLELLEEEENYRNTHLLYEFTPYSKQREFIDAGHDYPERCFMAGNQLGKSFTGAAEVAFHLTGRYPGTKGYPADGKYGGEWKGKRFYEPVVFWIGGETNETVTKTTQRILCGRIRRSLCIHDAPLRQNDARHQKTKREKDTSPNQAHRTENLNGRRKQTQFHSV